jgi:hypothetical protein
VGTKSQEEKALKCVICKNGETEPGTTSILLERGKTTLVIKMCLLKYVKIVARDMWMKIPLNDFFKWQKKQQS